MGHAAAQATAAASDNQHATALLNTSHRLQSFKAQGGARSADETGPQKDQQAEK